MKVIFIRHGKDDDRYRGGWSELDLIPEGKEQAKRLADYLGKNKDTYKIKQIISSDLQRTMTTASYISDELGLPIIKESCIREMNNGDLAGMLNEIALERYPGLFASSLEMDEAYPNGESPNDFFGRINDWFAAFADEYKNTDSNILVVTHSGVINIIYHIVNSIEWSNKNKPFKVNNCSIHVLNLDTMKFEVENKIDFLRD